jgi:ABC-type Zn uptake system ZnuABC Zn-binding protein ZnuA
VASNFYPLWDECPTNLWTLPTFSDLENWTREDLASPVAAAATSQVKLCPYDEEEPHIWFRLIEAQIAAAEIKSQKR